MKVVVDTHVIIMGDITEDSLTKSTLKHTKVTYTTHTNDITTNTVHIQTV